MTYTKDQILFLQKLIDTNGVAMCMQDCNDCIILNLTEDCTYSYALQAAQNIISLIPTEDLLEVLL